MTPEEGLKLLADLNVDPNLVITTEVRMIDMLMLNELIEACRDWQHKREEAGFDIAGSDEEDRLAAAIDVYIATEESKSGGNDND